MGEGTATLVADPAAPDSRRHVRALHIRHAWQERQADEDGDMNGAESLRADAGVIFADGFREASKPPGFRWHEHRFLDRAECLLRADRHHVWRRRDAGR